MRWRKFCGWLLRLLGWTAVEPLPEEKKCIMLGVPHTTVWDFFISYLYFKSIGGDGLCMIKKEMFFPPLGWILRAMGGIPVDRANSGALVPSATIVRPMITPGTLKVRANAELPSTKKSAPLTSAAKPTISNKIFRNSKRLCLSFSYKLGFPV